VPLALSAWISKEPTWEPTVLTPMSSALNLTFNKEANEARGDLAITPGWTECQQQTKIYVNQLLIWCQEQMQRNKGTHTSIVHSCCSLNSFPAKLISRLIQTLKTLLAHVSQHEWYVKSREEVNVGILGWGWGHPSPWF
jgi:hypothetical protein